MTDQGHDKKVLHFQRPAAHRARPDRKAMNIYRSDDGEGGRGSPFAAPEDATVAAVRMAYRIAERQIDRSTALAKRLRVAGDRATGGDSTRDAVDSAGRLVNNAMMSGLAWVEALAASDDTLGNRLISAQLRAVQGVLFGRGRQDGATAEPGPPSPPPTPAAATAGQTFTDPGPTIRRVKVVLAGDPARRRAVRVALWELSQDISAELYFAYVGRPGARPLKAKLVARPDDGGRRALVMDEIPPETPSGRWRAAVCDEGGVQCGILEIEL